MGSRRKTMQKVSQNTLQTSNPLEIVYQTLFNNEKNIAPQKPSKSKVRRVHIVSCISIGPNTITQDKVLVYRRIMFFCTFIKLNQSLLLPVVIGNPVNTTRSTRFGRNKTSQKPLATGLGYI